MYNLLYVDRYKQTNKQKHNKHITIFTSYIYINYKLRNTSTVSSVVYRGFESGSGQTKDYKIGICFISSKHAALRRKSKE